MRVHCRQSTTCSEQAMIMHILFHKKSKDTNSMDFLQPAPVRCRAENLSSSDLQISEHSLRYSAGAGAIMSHSTVQQARCLRSIYLSYHWPPATSVSNHGACGAAALARGPWPGPGSAPPGRGGRASLPGPVGAIGKPESAGVGDSCRCRARGRLP